MATEAHLSDNTRPESRFHSIFDLPPDFFDGCCVLSDRIQLSSPSSEETVGQAEVSTSSFVDWLKNEEEQQTVRSTTGRWSCNMCKADLESLQDQRAHFKSDFHRFNVKLTVAGKRPLREDQLEELSIDTFSEDFDISSISGSEDEADEEVHPSISVHHGGLEGTKQKLIIRLRSGEILSLWKCILWDENDHPSLADDSLAPKMSGEYASRRELIVARLANFVHEPRDRTQLRVVLLARGGHFAGCVFDGNSVVAHKTFHRYVVRAKAGKKQSAKDATGKAAKSAGSTLRRYNELALKKEIQELLDSWKQYFTASKSIFVYAPSNNRQLFYDGEKAHFSHHNGAVRRIPLTVRRPTLKEAKRIYNHLTLVAYEEGHPLTVHHTPIPTSSTEQMNQGSEKEMLSGCVNSEEAPSADIAPSSFSELVISSVLEEMPDTKTANETTPLHQAAKSGDALCVLQLLEQGSDPSVKDSRGKTPYMLAADKEVRNTFRRFMALNLDKWDWHAANVPSALTKEMEEAQAAKQAEKDAKRKAKAKELKKMRKAKEKTQAQALAQSSVKSHSQGSSSGGTLKSTHSSGVTLVPEEERQRIRVEEREKRAAAAERRIAALSALNPAGSDAKNSTAISDSKSSSIASSEANRGSHDDALCSCCSTSLAGKVPFHRYHYKYCSTSCMYVHKQMLEDG